MWLAFHFRYPFFSKVCTCHTIGKLFIRSTVSTIIYICVFSRKYPAIRNYHFNTSSSFLSLALSGYSGVGFSSYEMNKLRLAHQCPLNDVSWLQISNRESAASEQTAALWDSSLWNTVMVVGFSECHTTHIHLYSKHLDQAFMRVQPCVLSSTKEIGLFVCNLNKSNCAAQTVSCRYYWNSLTHRLL